MSSLGHRAWWAVPGHFSAPLVFYLEEDLEEYIFGQGDAYLRCIELHSHTLIQLEQWFTATGQTRVTIVGPLQARQWLVDMVWSLGSRDHFSRARGLEMLRRVRSQPLTKDDLATSSKMQSDTWDLPFVTRISGTISLEVPNTFPHKLLGLGFSWSSLYP